jgi:hypothetical protein
MPSLQERGFFKRVKKKRNRSKKRKAKEKNIYRGGGENRGKKSTRGIYISTVCSYISGEGKRFYLASEGRDTGIILSIQSVVDFNIFGGLLSVKIKYKCLPNFQQIGLEFSKIPKPSYCSISWLL